MLRGAARREERWVRFQAQMTANLMNCWTRDRVTAEMLLGLPDSGPVSYAAMNEAQKSQAVDMLWKAELQRRARPEKKRKRLHE